VDLPYLVDSLREAAGIKRAWGTVTLPEDEQPRCVRHAVIIVVATLAGRAGTNRQRTPFEFLASVIASTPFCASGGAPLLPKRVGRTATRSEQPIKRLHANRVPD
jgi:hypothetical protein